MMTDRKRITGGLYLVVDPAMDTTVLLNKITQALQGGVKILQIYDNWDKQKSDALGIINRITPLCHEHQVPVLLNDQWQLLSETQADGVHFDTIPENFTTIRKALKTDAIIGITCTNDLKVIEWAENNQLDYISFCSMFPSKSVDSCEIVDIETVRKARAITNMPIFLAGGIDHENLTSFSGLDFNGIALISGIMKAEDTYTSTKKFTSTLNKLIHYEN